MAAGLPRHELYTAHVQLRALLGNTRKQRPAASQNAPTPNPQMSAARKQLRLHGLSLLQKFTDNKIAALRTDHSFISQGMELCVENQCCQMLPLRIQKNRCGSKALSPAVLMAYEVVDAV